MEQEESKLLKKIEAYVSQKMEDVDAGHDMSHVKRVLCNAQKINNKERGDEFLIQAGVFLHDVTDEKLFRKKKAEKELNDFLKEIKVSKPQRVSLFGIINSVSFGAEFDGTEELSLEQKVVRDADRLDAMGAIGIARAFHYGGRKKRSIFNSNIPPQKYQSSEAYRKSTSPTINHFYEKLLLLKSRMETSTGKKLAEQRHNYMIGFLKQFYDEIGEEGFSLD